MNLGIALLTLSAAAVMALAAGIAVRRRRRTRAVPGGLDLDLVSAAELAPPGLRHLGARLREPRSLGLRIPAPHVVASHRRLGQLIGLR
jgi:hypothetical protein